MSLKVKVWIFVFLALIVWPISVGLTVYFFIEALKSP